MLAKFGLLYLKLILGVIPLLAMVYFFRGWPDHLEDMAFDVIKVALFSLMVTIFHFVFGGSQD